MSGEIWYKLDSGSVADWNRSEITINDHATDSSKQAQRAVIQFLLAEGISGTDIYSPMMNVYGTECMSRTAVFRWCSDFRHGSEYSGHAMTRSSTCGHHSRINCCSELLCEGESSNNHLGDCRQPVCEQRNCWHYSSWTFAIQQVLCTMGLKTSENQKCLQMGVCFQHLLRYRRGKQISGLNCGLRRNLVPFLRSGNGTNEYGMAKFGLSLPRKNSFNSSRESEAVFFWREWPLDVAMVENGRYSSCKQILRYLTQTENSHQESQTWHVKRGNSIAWQCPSSCGKSLQRSAVALPMGSCPSPPYSPDLSPCDFHVFGPLKSTEWTPVHNDEVRETVE